MSEEKCECKEKIFVRAGFVLGIISIIITFVPVINYMSYVTGLLAVLFSLISIWKKNSKQVAYFGLLLGFLSILITYIMFIKNIDFAFNKIVDSNKKYFSSVSEESENNNTEDILLNELDVEIGEYESENSEFDYEYEYDYIYYNPSKLPVKLKNKSGEIKSFNVMIEAVDENGDRITEDTVYVDSLRNGQSYKTEAFEYSSGEQLEKLKSATFRILKVYSY